MRRAGAAAFVALAVTALRCGGLVDESSRPHVTIGFHGDRARTGWVDDETALTPEVVGSSTFGRVWSSPPFDALDFGSVHHPAHAFASPLRWRRGSESWIFAATSNGFAYAVRAGRGDIVWRSRLTDAAPVPKLDGGVPLGVLSTPVLDVTADPPRLYVVSRDAARGWMAFALDAVDGSTIAGWPVVLDDAAVAAANKNGSTRFERSDETSQRAALALSPNGDTLYVASGGYTDGATGWIIAVDTTSPRVRSSFSGSPANAVDANGHPFASAGMWSPAGPAVDDDGRVFIATGNSPEADSDAAHVWGQSLLAFSRDLDLLASFTPFNHCQMEVADTDLGGSSPVLLSSGLTVFGGKQGTVYLVDRDALPGNAQKRPACSTDSETDASLLPPGPQPQFHGRRGPLNVFGPYSETHGNLDYAKMRSTAARFGDLLFVSGTSKAAEDSQTSVPPCLARLRIDGSGAQRWLAVDAVETETSFVNPGSPVVTSNGTSGGVVWVLDENAPRTASLVDPSTPPPVLYAFDARTMKRLWRSLPGDLAIGGKYGTPAIGEGEVVVATDRLVAFGVKR